MGISVGRRDFLTGSSALLGAGSLAGCALKPGSPAGQGGLFLTPPRLSTDRITNITVCTRPFRPQGPRLEIEQIGAKTVVHNYGHGGSGWSLSWGSSAIAVEMALAGGDRDIAVIGCGALGLTSALLLQRAGAHVTIYSKDLPPNVRSFLASGVWSPDSRICLEQHATPDLKQQWERMCRLSFKTYQSLLGLDGTPVEFIDSYFVSDEGPPERHESAPDDRRPAFAHLQRALTADLMPHGPTFEPGQHSLGHHRVQQTSFMMFNIPSLTRLLMNDFLLNEGLIEIREFRSPSDFAALRQRTLINATGYGARALMQDMSIIPVRGQLARLIPQPEVNYSLYYNDVSFVPRRDGLVCQVIGPNDYYGYDNDSVTPDRQEAELAVKTIAALFKS